MACKGYRFVKKCPLLPLKTLHPFPGELVKQTCTWSIVRNWKHLLEWLLLSRGLLHFLEDFFLSSALTYWAVRALNPSFPYLILLLPLSELADMSKRFMQACLARAIRVECSRNPTSMGVDETISTADYKMFLTRRWLYWESHPYTSRLTLWPFHRQGLRQYERAFVLWDF